MDAVRVDSADRHRGGPAARRRPPRRAPAGSRRTVIEVGGLARHPASHAARGRSPAGVRKNHRIRSGRAKAAACPLVGRYVPGESSPRGARPWRSGSRSAARRDRGNAIQRSALPKRGRYHVVLLDEYQDTSQRAAGAAAWPCSAAGHPGDRCRGPPASRSTGWRGASAGGETCAGFTRDFPARSGTDAPVRLLFHQLPQTRGRVLEAAAVLQAQLRDEAPDVPGPGAGGRNRGGRGSGCAARWAARGDPTRRSG